MPSCALTTQLLAGNQPAGRGNSDSPGADHGVQCGPASNPTTSLGQAAWAAAYNLGVGDGTPRSALTTGSLEEGSGPRGLGNQSLPLSSLGDQEDKNIYGQFSSLWGQPGTEQGCFFPWLWLRSQDGGSWGKYRLFTRPTAGPERLGRIQFPLSQQGRELLESCPEEQGWVSVLC